MCQSDHRQRRDPVTHTAAVPDRNRTRQHDLAGGPRREASVGQRKPGSMTRSGGVLGVVVLVAAGAPCAQDLEPKAYVNTPVRMNFLIASYAYSEGGVSTDASLPIQGAHLSKIVSSSPTRVL
jgi:hypothetical protein